MVVKKWGQQVLDTFEINKAMIDMDEEAMVDCDVIADAAEEKSPCAAEARCSDSSASGGDSNAGQSEAALGERWAMAPGTALAVADNGEGAGWPGPQGDGRVRQWQWPKPDASAASDAGGPVAAGATSDVLEMHGLLEGTQVSPIETQLMDVEETNEMQGMPVSASVVGEAEVSEGDLAMSRSTTEGHEQGKGVGQQDLKHWLK